MKLGTNITISEMARLHGVSRQTLIYYDKIDLFKPEIIRDNGYRYYSLQQIPILREICFLRSLEVSLDDIKKHLGNRSPEEAIAFFTRQYEQKAQEIAHLTEIQDQFKARLSVYKPHLQYELQRDEPAIHYFTERRVIFVPFPSPMNREKLHYTMMLTWRSLTSFSYLPSHGFGAIIRQANLQKEDKLLGAGCYITLPKHICTEEMSDNILIIPAGYYVTRFKSGMPYETKHLDQLLQWMEENGHQPCGDVVDACIFDTTFYTKKLKNDFCQLQIPISIER